MTLVWILSEPKGLFPYATRCSSGGWCYSAISISFILALRIVAGSSRGCLFHEPLRVASLIGKRTGYKGHSGLHNTPSLVIKSCSPCTPAPPVSSSKGIAGRRVYVNHQVRTPSTMPLREVSNRSSRLIRLSADKGSPGVRCNTSMEHDERRCVEACCSMRFELMVCSKEEMHRMMKSCAQLSPASQTNPLGSCEEAFGQVVPAHRIRSWSRARVG